ncbi:MAG: RNA polymerase sigma factor [Candidatus Cyclobacteriaceae bacterium M3_2C_046]
MGQHISDKELIQKCIGNERKYQEILYRKFAGKMYAICLSYAKDRSAAQDILQDGFVKVFQKMKTYSQEGSLEGWIRRIITNTAIDYYRKQARSNNLLEYEDEKNLDPNEETVLNLAEVSEIYDHLQKLPDGARVIFNLYALEGYSHKEIAKLLNISEGTSKSQVNRARSLLQKMILTSSK